jgi:hypothetical protein
MDNSQKPENEKPASGAVPSPPLPKIPSPSIPDIQKSPAPKPVEKKPSPAASFHLADSAGEVKAKESAPDAIKKDDPSPTKTAATPQSATPKPFSRAAVPGPKSTPTPQKTAPHLATHKPGAPSPATPQNKELHQSLEHRPLSIEEKEKLHGTGPAEGWNKFLEFLQPIALWLVRVSVLFAAGSAAFILINLIHGNLGAASPLSNSEQLLHPLRIASLTLEVSLITLACCLTLLWFNTSAVAFSVLAVGIFLHLGTPLLLLIKWDAPPRPAL